jgi:hypothetical protein
MRATFESLTRKCWPSLGLLPAFADAALGTLTLFPPPG